MKRNRLIAFILSLIMLIGSWPEGVFAAEMEQTVEVLPEQTMAEPIQPAPAGEVLEAVEQPAMADMAEPATEPVEVAIDNDLTGSEAETELTAVAPSMAEVPDTISMTNEIVEPDHLNLQESELEKTQKETRTTEEAQVDENTLLETGEESTQQQLSEERPDSKADAVGEETLPSAGEELVTEQIDEPALAQEEVEIVKPEREESSDLMAEKEGLFADNQQLAVDVEEQPETVEEVDESVEPFEREIDLNEPDIMVEAPSANMEEVSADNIDLEVDSSSQQEILGNNEVDPFYSIRLEISIDKNTVNVGETLTASWKIYGIEGMTYSTTCSWQTLYADGRLTEIRIQETMAGFASFTPQRGEKGRFMISILVDGRDVTEFSSFVEIVGAPTMPTLSLSLQLDRSTAEIGQPVTASWVVTGGMEPYRYSYQWTKEELPTNAWTMSEPASSSVFVPVDETKYRFFIRVWDAEQNTVEQCSDYVTIENSMWLIFYRQVRKARVGNEITLYWGARGGVEPYTYSFQWITEDEQGTTIFHPLQTGITTANTIESNTFASNEAGKCYLYIKATDAMGRSAEKYSDDIIVVYPLKLNIQLDKSIINAGETVTASYTLSGGLAPYSDFLFTLYTVFNDGYIVSEELNGSSNSTIAFAPKMGTTCYLSVSARDSSGEYISQETDNVQITGSPVVSPLNIQVTVDKERIVLGETVSANWRIEGGVEPYEYSCSWHIEYFDGTVRSETFTSSELSGSSGYAPIGNNVRRTCFTVNVRDSQGRTKYVSSKYVIIDYPILVDIHFDSLSIAKGENIVSHWSIDAFAQPLSYTYRWICEEIYYPSADFHGTNLKGTSIFTPAQGKKWRLHINGHDADGRTFSQYSDYVKVAGAEPVEPLSLNVQVEKTKILPGETVTASWTVSGGFEANWKYEWYWMLETLDGQFIPTNATTSPREGINITYFSPQEGCSCRFYITATDNIGNQLSICSEIIEITMGIDISFDKGNVDLGHEISALWDIRNGVSPYSYSYQWLTEDAEGAVIEYPAHTGSVSSSTFTAAEGEKCRLHLVVTDAKGRETNTYSNDVKIVHPVHFEPHFDKTEVRTGDTVYLSWDVRGGIGEYNCIFKWIYEDVEGNQYEHQMDVLSTYSGAQDRLPYTPERGSRFRVYFDVRDGEGRVHEGYSDYVIIKWNPTQFNSQPSISSYYYGSQLELDIDWNVQGGFDPVVTSAKVSLWFEHESFVSEKKDHIKSFSLGVGTHSLLLYLGYYGNYGRIELVVEDPKSGYVETVSTETFSITNPPFGVKMDVRDIRTNATGTAIFSNGSWAKGWVQNLGGWYYGKDNGLLHTGWLLDGGSWYYLNPLADGKMSVGWLKDGGSWYYLNSSGAMATGWVYDNAWYYMQSSGAMATGWVNDGGTWYYMSDSGAMSTGWVYSGNQWYYMDGSGAMATGYRYIDGRRSLFDTSGVWLGYR